MGTEAPRTGEGEASVEPLRSLEAVRIVKECLADHPRDLLLFTLGINGCVKAGDLLRVTVNRVRAARPGETVTVRVKRPGSPETLTVSAEARDALRRHLATLGPPPPPADMYLFAGQRGWTPLTVERLDELVREWTRAAGIPGRFGADTLRKTFGYLQRVAYGVGLDALARAFQHPSPLATRTYLGLTGEPGSGVTFHLL